MRTARTILAGGLVVGALDIAYAIIFWAVLRGTNPLRIFQSVAAGLLGPASIRGGIRTAILGAVLHFFIATVIVAVYWLASRFWSDLVRRPYIWGALYGLAVYGVMNYVVIPLSAASRPRFFLPWVALSIVVHIFLVGVPAALFARAANRVANDPAFSVSAA